MDAAGRTALMWAAICTSTEIARMLLDAGAHDTRVSTLETSEAKRYRIWIDQKSGLLLRVDIRLRTADGTHDQPGGCHAFSSYNGEISIEPPPRTLFQDAETTVIVDGQ